MSEKAGGLWMAYTMACIGGAMIAHAIDRAMPQLMGRRSWEDGYGTVVFYQILFTPILLIVRLCLGAKRVNWRVGAVVGLSPLLLLLIAFIFRR